MKPDCIKQGLQAFAAIMLAMALSGCASGSYDDADDGAAPTLRTASALPRENGQNRVESQAGQQALQCVPYAREHSQIKLFGDAYTWWNQAAGKYERGAQPATGAVMVLFNYAGPNHGHLAVVKRIVSAREIRIDHANWLDDGSIYVNDPVVDVSAGNDWSAIKVWNIKTGGWGLKIYPVQGFIGSGSNSVPDTDTRVADVPEEAQDTNGQDAPIANARIARATPAPRTIRVKAAQPSPPALPGQDSHALTADDLAIP